MNTRKKIFFCFIFTFFTTFVSIYSYDIVNIINPVITANPVEVIIWVKDGVTAENETRVLEQIGQGLNMLEAVPTSHLAFTIIHVSHGTTEPAHLPHQLFIIVGNTADLTSGGASFPNAGGNPGTWFGAVADNLGVNIPLVCAHEVGHAVGLHHTTINHAFPPGCYPLMNWAIAGQSGVPTADDIAALSIAYPNPGQSLNAITGTIRGRLLIRGTTIPISGVNVVAVNQATGIPIVARFSGPRATLYGGELEGEFILPGLPPGVYEVHYLDGNSFRGMVAGIQLPGDGRIFNGLRYGYQADNFTEFTSLPITVTANNTVNLGDIDIPIEKMSFDGIHEGDLTFGVIFDPMAGEVLPNAEVGLPYNVWLHIRGGLRDIIASVGGLPPGLSGTISGDTRGHNAGVHGNHFLYINGTPTTSGHRTLNIMLSDARGTNRYLNYNLSVEPYETTGLVALYHFEGNTLDSSGNGHTGINFGASFVPDRNGIPHSALYFDGDFDYLELPHEWDFDLPEFTIVAIMSLPELNLEDDWIISKGDYFGNYTFRRYGSAGNWKGYAGYVHQTMKGNWSAVSSAGRLPENQFFKIAFCVSRTEFRAYIDDVLVRQFPNPSVPRYNDSPVNIGRGGYYMPDNYFQGIIDELAIFRGCVDETTMRTLFRFSKSKKSNEKDSKGMLQ